MYDKKMNLYLTLQVRMGNWHQNITKESMIMLQEQFIGNCVENTNWKEMRNGVNMLQTGKK